MNTATIKNDTEVLQWSEGELLYGHVSRLISKGTEIRMLKGQLQSYALTSFTLEKIVNQSVLVSTSK